MKIHFLSALMIFIIAACGDQPAAEEKTVPPAQVAPSVDPDYDFGTPFVIKLKKKLKEISGITFAGEGKIAAVQDETGEVYILDAATGDVMDSFKFSGDGDYEDIAADADNFYILESSGIIYSVPRSLSKPAEPFKLPGKKKKEFESLYIFNNKLIMLCKECRHDDESKEANCFDLEKKEFEMNTCYTIDLSGVMKKLPPGSLLKPSAAAINPADKKLYVVCSVGKTLLRCSVNGVIEKSIPLDEKLFRQPEGICFSQDGTMYISNEAAGEHATLVKVSPKK